jgi:phosphatidylglycerophosphate synthase
VRQATERALDVCYAAAEKTNRGLIKIVYRPTKLPQVSGDGILTVPTLISFTRIPLGFLAAYCIATGKPAWWAVLILAIATYTDILDGSLARLKGPTRWGALIDPWCDKAFVGICAASLYVRIWTPVFWVLSCLEFLLFLVPWFALRMQTIDVRSNVFGKAKLTAECFGILALAMDWNLLGNFLLTCAIPLAVYSAVKKARQLGYPK